MNFLLELGFEDLPALKLYENLSYIQKTYEEKLKEYSISCEFKFLKTPRRLVFFSENFKKEQEDKTEEFFGPPVNIAYKDGVLTKAGLGFLKKCSIEEKQLQKAQQKGKTVLYYQKTIKGKKSEEILPVFVEDFFNSLKFSKTMFWQSYNTPFLRPLRWFNVFYNDNSLKLDMLGLSSNNFTYVNRSFSQDKFYYKNAKEYFNILQNNGVVLENRKELILKSFKKLEEKYAFNIEKDENLLNETEFLCEDVNVCVAKFDEDFLNLPPELIRLSMKEHQKYFPVFKNDKLSSFFVFNSNIKNNEKVIKGNEKVLKARLDDAKFFYENDLKEKLNLQGLDKISFMQGLGSLEDKINRELKILQALNLLNEEELSLAKKATLLSFNDLLTQSVYEFTELEGIIGYYLAKEMGLNENVALAIKEKRSPNPKLTTLPSNRICAVVALSFCFDNILSLFSISKIPTGSKDPFALRRSCANIFKICAKYNLNIDINTFDAFKDVYKEIDNDKLFSFFKERFIKLNSSVNPSLVLAVLNSNNRKTASMQERVDALNNVLKSYDLKKLTSTFKRVANISEKCEGDVDYNLLKEKDEINLYNEFQNLKDASYEEKLKNFFSLPFESFFENVLINCEEKDIRRNRVLLISKIYAYIKNIADIKEITSLTTS